MTYLGDPTSFLCEKEQRQGCLLLAHWESTSEIREVVAYVRVVEGGRWGAYRALPSSEIT